MNNSITSLSNKLVVPVVNSDGKPVITKVSATPRFDTDLVNVPFPELFGDEPIIKIQYAKGEELTPVTYNGNVYIPWYGWGSAIKGGETIGMRRDLMAGLARVAEDSMRFGRWAMCQGWYGLGKGAMRVKFVPAGTLVAGAPVEDGFGYMADDIVTTITTGRPKIKLGRSKGTYTFWQRVPNSPELEAELLPGQFERLERTNMMHAMLECSADRERQALADIDATMLEHPSIAHFLIRSQAEYLARLVTTLPVGSVMKVAVPTTCEKVAVSKKSIVTRYPIDSYGSCQAVMPDRDRAEIERIDKLEVVQYSLSSHTLAVKGCAGLVDRDDIDGYDAILCIDDIKMWVGEQKPELIEAELIITLLQHFAAGSAIGISAHWAKDLMGLDHDGDMAEVTDCTQYPVLWDTVAAFPQWGTPKLPKSKSPITDENRQKFLRNSFSNLVGLASNVASRCLAASNQDDLAVRLGYKDARALHARLNFWIKCGTEFKTSINRQEIEKSVFLFQRDLAGHVPQVPYVSWPNDWAFTHGLPPVVEGMFKDDVGKLHYQIAGTEVELDDNQRANAILPDHDGLVAAIYRVSKPMLEDLNLDMAATVRPLGYYKSWVPEPSEQFLAWATVVQDEYNYLQSRANLTDPQEVGALKTLMQQLVNQTIGTLNHYQAAQALWWLAHSKRSEFATANSVFLVFPEECARIVREKPGKAVSRTVLVGAEYQVPGLQEWAGTVELKTVKITKGAKVIIRTAVVGKVPNQQQPRDTRYPANMIGLVAENVLQPEAGTYQAQIAKASNGSWTLSLA